MSKIEIIFEDEHYVFVNKLAGMLSIPHRTKLEEPNLKNYLERLYGQIYVNHRIDRETSGLICFSKTKEAHRAFALQQEHNLIEKYYVAFVHGRMPKNIDLIDEPIVETNQRGVYKVHFSGKPSKTSYKVLKTFKTFQYVKFRIFTGRTHQIRVHCSFLNAPLINDTVYGSSGGIYLSDYKKKYNTTKYGEESSIMHRIALHSCELKFDAFDKTYHIQSPLLKDMQTVLKIIEKWDTTF